MHESDRHLLNILYRIFHPIYHYSGAEYIYRKAVPTKKPQQHPLPTLPLWLIGIYIALFGLASQRYENRIDIIERKVTSLYTRLTPITSVIMQSPAIAVKTEIEKSFNRQNWPEYEELKGFPDITITKEKYNELRKREELRWNKRDILSKIPAIQNYPCPVVPSVFKPHKTIRSLFENTVHKETVEELKELITDSKRDLVGVDLKGADLRGAELDGANLEGALFWDANLKGTNFSGANLEGASLDDANLQGANLRGAYLADASLDGAFLDTADLEGANLDEANLQGANLREAYLADASLDGANIESTLDLTIKQLSNVKTLFKAKLDPELMEQVKAKYPRLLKNLKKPKDKESIEEGFEFEDEWLEEQLSPWER